MLSKIFFKYSNKRKKEKIERKKRKKKGTRKEGGKKRKSQRDEERKSNWTGEEIIYHCPPPPQIMKNIVSNFPIYPGRDASKHMVSSEKKKVLNLSPQCNYKNKT